MIPKLLQFIEIDEETKRRGQEIWQLLEPRVDGILVSFYDNVKSYHVTTSLTDDSVGRLIGKQKRHWSALFRSKFDDEYAKSVRRIGIRHREINLDLVWFIMGYSRLKIAFTGAIIDSELPPITKGRLLKALEKYIAFDMALAMSTYSADLLD